MLALSRPKFSAQKTNTVERAQVNGLPRTVIAFGFNQSRDEILFNCWGQICNLTTYKELYKQKRVTCRDDSWTKLQKHVQQAENDAREELDILKGTALFRSLLHKSHAAVLCYSATHDTTMSNLVVRAGYNLVPHRILLELGEKGRAQVEEDLKREDGKMFSASSSSSSSATDGESAKRQKQS